VITRGGDGDGALLWSQKRAVRSMEVSVSYLRASDCPKVLLPGNGPGKKPLVRYDPREVLKWANRYRDVPSTNHHEEP
jgi:hypothetical protein